MINERLIETRVAMLGMLALKINACSEIKSGQLAKIHGAQTGRRTIIVR
jgi:hypothetical protein